MAGLCLGDVSVLSGVWLFWFFAGNQSSVGDHPPAPGPGENDSVFPPPLCGPALSSFLQHRADAKGCQCLLEAMPAQALLAH